MRTENITELEKFIKEYLEKNNDTQDNLIVGPNNLENDNINGTLSSIVTTDSTTTITTTNYTTQSLDSHKNYMDHSSVLVVLPPVTLYFEDYLMPQDSLCKLKGIDQTVLSKNFRKMLKKNCEDFLHSQRAIDNPIKKQVLERLFNPKRNSKIVWPNRLLSLKKKKIQKQFKCNKSTLRSCLEEILSEPLVLPSKQV